MYETFLFKDLVSINEYRDILRTFNNVLVDDVIETGNMYFLPYYNGMFTIKKTKQKSLFRKIFMFRWNPELKKKERFETVVNNSHSNGYSAKFWWYKRNKYFRGIYTSWVLKVAGHHKRNLALALINRHKSDIYYE
jgi:hypothetical protein